jgi:DNA-directed RNA polymerase subunit RPC12/RpoP
MRPELIAWCTSLSCVNRFLPGFKSKDRTKLKVLKDVKKSAIDCPDCGSSLVWKKPMNHKKAEILLP